MLQEVPLVLRLNPADDVVIARRQLVAGTLLKTKASRCSGWFPRATRSRRAPSPRAAGAPLQPDHRLRDARHPRGRARAPAQPRHRRRAGADFGARLRVRGRRAHRRPPSRAGDLQGHRPRRRPRRDAQLRRDPLERELLGDGRARDRGPLPARPLPGCARALSQRRRRRRADARHRLRHGHGREHARAAPDHGRLCAPPQRRGGALHRSRLRGQPDDVALRRESLQESERMARYNMQDVGGTAKAIERGVALVREMLPTANRVERTPCRRAT